MKEKVIKIDDSPAVKLPEDLLLQMGIKVDDEVQIHFIKEKGQIVISKIEDLGEWSKKFIKDNKEFYDELKDK